MSFTDDFYSRFFVHSWTMAIGYQAGTALVDMVSYWMNKDDPMTDYYRVIKRGEIRNGWKLAIPLSSMCNGFHDSPVIDMAMYTSINLLPSSNDEEESSWPSLMSIIFRVATPHVNGGQVHSIRQYSLIKPSASSTLLKIYSRRANQWLPAGQCYLNASTVMILFRNILPPHEYRVFLVNLWSKKSRSVRIAPPALGVIFMHGYLVNTAVDDCKPPSLRLVFYQSNTLDDLRWKVIDAQYALPDPMSYRDTQIVQPSSIESILFPPNHSYVSFFANGYPVMAMSYNEINMHNTDEVMCITFDRHRWSSIRLTEWLRRYESTSDGRAVLNAAKAFVDLRPPSRWSWFVQVPAVLPLGRVLVFPGDGNEFVLGKTDYGGIIRRWIRPPSALRLAAEAIFRARPNVKMAEIEKATGVRVSDGIPEDGTEEDAVIVSL